MAQRPHRLRVISGIVAANLFGLGACVATSPGGFGAVCSSDGVEVDMDFPGAGLHDCRQGGDGDFRLRIVHEPSDSGDINPSPWFAFRITSDTPRSLNVTLDYRGQAHRYPPWVKAGSKPWERLSADKVVLSDDRSQAKLSVSVGEGETFVAAQPVSSAEDGLAFVRKILAGHTSREVRYGLSREGRPLVGFVFGNENAELSVVAVTRQHPPETTGQDAFQAFIARLASANDLSADAFRRRYRIILAPMPNPDGVDGGHWRLNSGGIDLNRDWGRFSQPETASLASWILQETGGRPVAAFIDFHSTNRTVVYAPPVDAPSKFIGLLAHMKMRFDTDVQPPPSWSYSHNPEGGTSKAWALDVLKAPGITLELWDQISPDVARSVGSVAAEAVMSYSAP